MKKSIFFVLFIVLFAYPLYSQRVSCDDLVEFVEDEGYKKGEVSSYQLIESKWLKRVVAYTIDYKTVVIAEIKRDEYGINTKKYIFCGVPDGNWTAFQYGLYDVGLTYGERFHKYIFDYQCSCY